MQLLILACHHVDSRIDRQIRTLGRWSRLVTVREGLECLRSGKGAARMTALTFDDGYDEVHRFALPALKRAGCPASVFIPSGVLESDAPFWWDRVNQLIDAARASSLEWRDGVFDIATQQARRKTSDAIRSSLRRLPPAEIRAGIRELEKALGLEELELPVTFKCLNREQLIEIAGMGIEVGSHTVTHPCLTALSGAEAKYELEVSRQHLEKVLGRPVPGLAYPFGGREYFDDSICELARQVGYEYAVTTLPGLNWDAASPYKLRRYYLTMNDNPIVLFAMATGLWSLAVNLRKLRHLVKFAGTPPESMTTHAD